ncbi:N-acetyl-1-D-myo-inositol-2-amino-2-deoxy-alpha-D-glucopyranoside deacetylase [Streptomyces radicis]|uniref:1D-myo-inositol 2-acetamido-2-deoxy-alpha-D-glucopyranoside deacetylase n=1 Tax=Streptomyces radicis TaxID=1750517 RepID=A0A3A9W766_9ACTN|nr:N-acetyl-1-D-myo-inositol-2-amino-2-deoxy-alpha-D-glucopyranoside deacetylase [Streptomyces radicis]RKN09051.1 N-acetyl-1-D-myo-inositol-2-amino-2-deoxy-alpha-D-glucopyranoside deacetylase [Streptomyces radicis]RKN22758.1 N-acetyl-1-D-myo-inositol-2-amino-2-deoxy-alpha-D-glucopyranoside deacetylase [Streptomyces radicis]
MSSGPARVLLVHAHPDDESICNGVTMAAARAAGHAVTLVTCTLGEEGEVIPAELTHLVAGWDDALGPFRATELAAAMRALGVTDHRFLGGPGRWSDSGMMGLPSNDAPTAFWRADLDEAGAALAEIIAEVRPAVLITYDPHGGYGHPDHIKAHRVALRGAELAASHPTAPHRVARVLWCCLPRSAAEKRLDALRAAGPGPFAGVASIGDLPGVVEDDEVALAVTGTPEQVAAKAAAMAAHATQVEVARTREGPIFALSNGLAQPLWDTEFYRLAAGAPLPPGARDVFAGLDLAPERPDMSDGFEGEGERA